MALLVVPQKPLPEVITPSDLRPDDKEQREIRIIRALLQSYLGIVKKNYTDMVPKTVMCMLVNKVKDEIASSLVHHLYAQISSPPVDVLLRETDDVASRRRELGDQLAVLHRGIAILNEIRDSVPVAPLAPSGSAPSLAVAAAAAAAAQPLPAAAAAFSKSPPHLAFSGLLPAGNSPGAESVSSSGSSVYAAPLRQQPLQPQARAHERPPSVNASAPAMPLLSSRT